MSEHEIYMRRCIDLAKQAIGYTAPNPMVGAVLVYNKRIIGEGYHQQYGQPHAEVNCINAVADADKHLIAKSTLYVSLEPCAHFGKTPPCADLIIRNQVPTVVVGCRDPFKEVNGKGIEKLQAAGIEVIQPVLEEDCQQLNKRFFTFHTKQRPYVILKWAASADEKIAGRGETRVLISNEYTNRLVHKWRSEEPAILIGTQTALLDDPSLTTRLWQGKNPVRLVVDMNLRLPLTLKVFDGKQQTIVFNKVKKEEQENLLYYQLTTKDSLVQQLLHALYLLNIQSVLVEGGAKLLQSFIDENRWDEARVIINGQLIMKDGLAAPHLPGKKTADSIKINSDSIYYYQPLTSQ